MYTPQYDLSRLGIVSVIFNPVRYRSRYERYYKFHDHMARSGVNLFTVECIFDSATRFGLPPQKFEVTQAGNPHHFQIVAPSVMWMKENLINIGIQHLPSHIDRVAWVDADVEFENSDWPYLTMDALERYPIVQMFKIGYFTGPGGRHEILRRDYSFGYSIRHNKPIYPKHPDWYAHPGYAWAMRRDTFNAIGGLIDFCIVGSGDLHMAYALLGRIQESFPSGLHKDYRTKAVSWGDGVARAAGGGAFVGYVNVNLYHRWHGSRDNRNYINRWSILSDYRFSPAKDLERNDYTGVLYLTNRRHFGLDAGVSRLDEMEGAIVNYFVSRKEDSATVKPRVMIPNYRVPSAPPSPPRRRSLISNILNWFLPSGAAISQPAAPVIPPTARRRHQRRRRTAFY